MKDIIGLFAFGAFLAVASCGGNKKAKIINDFETQTRLEVRELTTSNALQAYLENIHFLDQQCRGDESRVLQQFGHNSKEHQWAIEKTKKTDAENLLRIELILEKYGHPKLDSVGTNAVSAPWMVIHHSPTYETREKHFKTLYKAYQGGNLTDNQMELMLDRMYRMKNNAMFQLPSPYQIEDKLSTLIALLKLDVE